jgi:hypothetical protein
MKKLVRMMLVALFATGLVVMSACDDHHDSYHVEGGSGYSDPYYNSSYYSYNTTFTIQVYVYNGSFGTQDSYGNWTGWVDVGKDGAYYTRLNPGQSTYIYKDLYSPSDKLTLQFYESAGYSWSVPFADDYQKYSVVLHGDGRPPDVEP